MLVASVYIYIFQFIHYISTILPIHSLYILLYSVGYTSHDDATIVSISSSLRAMARGSCWPEALGVLQMMEEDQVASAGPIW